MWPAQSQRGEPPRASASAQAFLLAQPLDGLELEQRVAVLGPVDVPLDPDQVVQVDDPDRTASDIDRLCVE
jgi:hypothetical protein